MCGNRVEELEAHVRELEASVEGLTDELVECKVRLRELESAVDEDLGFGSSDDTVASRRADTSNTKGTNETDNREGVAAGSDGDAEAESDAESSEESESDIIVA